MYTYYHTYRLTIYQQRTITRKNNKQFERRYHLLDVKVILTRSNIDWLQFWLTQLASIIQKYYEWWLGIKEPDDKVSRGKCQTLTIIQSSTNCGPLYLMGTTMVSIAVTTPITYLMLPNYLCNQCLSPLMRVGIQLRASCTTLCDKVCHWLATGWWFSPGPPVTSTNKTYRHDTTEILLKVAISTI